MQAGGRRAGAPVPLLPPPHARAIFFVQSINLIVDTLNIVSQLARMSKENYPVIHQVNPLPRLNEVLQSDPHNHHLCTLDPHGQGPRALGLVPSTPQGPA